MNTRPLDGTRQLTIEMHPQWNVAVKRPELACTVEWSEILCTLRLAGLTHRPAEAKGAATPTSGKRVPATRCAYGPADLDRAGLIPQPRHCLVGVSSFAVGRVILGSPALESLRSCRELPSISRPGSKAAQGDNPDYQNRNA